MNKSIIASLIVATVAHMALAEPLALGCTTLREDFDFAGIASYKCKTAVKNFEEAIIVANAQAETNRASIVTVARKHLQKCMDDAQAAGDLNKVVALEKALETADGEMTGDAADIVRLRTARDAQMVKIDKNLVASGIAAARALHVSLDFQKKEATKKGDIDEAKKIDAFQQKLSKWATDTKAKVVVVSPPSMTQATRKPELHAQPRQPVSTVKRLEPEAKVYTVHAKNQRCTEIGQVKAGDRIEIQYVDGKWAQHAHDVRRSPDKNPDFWTEIS